MRKYTDREVENYAVILRERALYSRRPIASRDTGLLNYLFTNCIIDFYREFIKEENKNKLEKEFLKRSDKEMSYYLNLRDDVVRLRESNSEGASIKWKNYCFGLINLFKESAFNDPLVIDFVYLLRNTALDNLLDEKDRKMALTQLRKILKPIYPDLRGRNTRPDVVKLALDYEAVSQQLKKIVPKKIPSVKEMKTLKKGLEKLYRFLDKAEIDKLASLSRSIRDMALRIVGEKNNHCYSERLKDWISQGKRIIRKHKDHLKLKGKPLYNAFCLNIRT